MKVDFLSQSLFNMVTMWKELILVCLTFTQIDGHGRLMDPPSRNAMWRFGFGTPINYSDNEVFCGGVGIQYKKNKGKCGVCGDDWSQKRPRDNENGGRYGTGTIAKTYFQGQVRSYIERLRDIAYS